MVAKFLSGLLEEAELRPCDYCDHLEGIRLRRKIAGNGVTMFLWYCTVCQRHARKDLMWISHAVITEWQRTGRLKDPTAVAILEDYSQARQCVICGQPGAELHHFAPQALAELFGEDWQRWPTADLCPYHHQQWHSIVTWYMRGPAAANETMKERYGTHERRNGQSIY